MRKQVFHINWMKESPSRLSLSPIISLILLCGYAFQARAQTQQPPPPVASQDSTLIAEAYHLQKSLGENVWSGWTNSTIPLLFITPNYEYAIGFPESMTGFKSLDQRVGLNLSVQARNRTLEPTLAASFTVEGVPAAVIGTPTALEKTPSQWVLTVTHEMFHVLQMRRGESEKVSQLKLGSEPDASWQLNFPFPYKDADVMRLIHLQGYLMYLAATMDESETKYAAGTSVEAMRLYKSGLARLSSDNSFYKYSQFQEWKEGVALYTEYRLSELAARGSYQPLEGFKQLPGYKSYQQLWDELYKNQLFLIKHAGRASQSRTSFYHLGFGKALLLDRLMPDWKTRYFAPNVWLDDLVMMALGQPTDLPLLAVGTMAPDFSLTSVTGERVSLSQYRGHVVLINFWQTWCPPCVEETPKLKALREKYAARGLVVLGITDRLDQGGVALLREFVRENHLNYPSLIDDKGTTAGQYSINAYPHLFLLDKEGRLVYAKHGSIQERELENEIEKVIKN